MQFKAGDIVPTGYVIELQSWENDADYYSTQTFFGLSKEEVEYLKMIGKLFKSSCNHSGSHGNADYTDALAVDVVELSHLFENGEQLLKDWFDISYADVSIEDGDITGTFEEDKFMDSVRDLLGEAVSYNYDFVRVLESIAVYGPVTEEFKIPEIPRISYEFA